MATSKRRQQLMEPFSKKRYQTSKDTNEEHLRSYLSSVKKLQDWRQATPEMIIDYLIVTTQLPGTGRTVIHAIECEFVASNSKNPTCNYERVGKHSSVIQKRKMASASFSKHVSKEAWKA